MFLTIPFITFILNVLYTMIHSIVEYDYSDMSNSTAPIYKYLIDGGSNLDILIFSGDDDAVCSTLGTQNWVRTHQLQTFYTIYPFLMQIIALF
jgi:hypothetical protein